MAKFIFDGIDKYTESLQRIGGKNAIGVLKYAVYPGAKVVADAIRQELEIGHRKTGELARSLTLTAMQNKSGYIYTKISFTGYDLKGTPNMIKAAALESGTSRGQKATHFMSRTVKNVSNRAVEEMSKALDEKIGKIMGG